MDAKKHRTRQISVFLALLLLFLNRNHSLAEEMNREKTMPETNQVLIEAPELLERIKADQAIALIDTRPREEYDAGHAPGAQWVEVGALKIAFDRGESASAWGEAIGSLGISPESLVIVYDDNLNPRSARTRWLLRYWGVENVAVLNGGWSAWIAAGGESTSEAPVPGKAAFPAQAHERLYMTGDRLRELIATGDAPQIVDTRSDMEFSMGTVPGALQLDWVDLIDQTKGKLHEREELLRRFAKAGIDPLKPSITYCKSGGRASIMVLALEALGSTSAINYTGGWTEWSASQGRGQ